MPAESNQNFVNELLDCQRNLYTYLYKLTLDASVARELLQETNTVLLTKQAEYPRIKCFGAWAAKIAHFQLLAYRKRCSREQLRLSPELVEMLSDEAVAKFPQANPMLDALGECMETLTPEDRELVDQRYSHELPSRKIAVALKRTPHAISQALYRIRVALGNCVRGKLAGKELE